MLARARQLSTTVLDGDAQPTSVRWVTNMASRWGSCTPSDGTIRVSGRLRDMPSWVLDYVLVHELAHLLVPGHGADFWELVGRYPRSERARGYLEGVAAAAHLDRPGDEPTRGRGRPRDRRVTRRAAALLLAGPPAARACPPGIAPAEFARALAEDVADLLADLPGLDPVVAAAPDRVADAEDVVWPGTPVLEIRGPAGRRAGRAGRAAATTRPPSSSPTPLTCPACWWPSRSRRCPPRRSRPHRPPAAGWSRWPAGCRCRRGCRSTSTSTSRTRWSG